MGGSDAKWAAGNPVHAWSPTDSKHLQRIDCTSGSTLGILHLLSHVILTTTLDRNIIIIGATLQVK